MTETSHRASIAITRFRALGHIPDAVAALLDRIDELEAEADGWYDELALLRVMKERVTQHIGPKVWSSNPSLSEAQHACDVLAGIQNALHEIEEAKAHV